MKKTTLYSMLTLLLLLVSGNSLAADKLFYTLSTPKSGGNTAYASNYDVEIDDMTWNAPGNQSFDGWWRIGGKQLDKVNRTIAAKTAMSSAICRIVFNHNGISNKTLTLHSLTLTVASDADFKNIIDQVIENPTITEAGTVEFVPTAEKGNTWPTEAYYKFDINVSNSTKSNYGLDLTSIEFFQPLASTGVAEPVIKLAPGNYVGDQLVEIEGGEDCASMDVKVYTTYPDVFSYTHMDGNKGRVMIHENCTVGVIAYDADGNASNEVFAKYTILKPISSISDIWDACTSAEAPALIEINGWTCTGVKGSEAYFTDGTNGILVYQSGHGFEVGDEISGTAQVKILIYNEYAEIKNLTSQTEGVTVTKGDGATAKEIAIADLETKHHGNLISLKGVTYDAATGLFTDDDDNTIMPYNKFITLPELADGKKYNVTGVAIWFKSKSTWEIAPRSAEEITLLSSQATPVSEWEVETTTGQVNDVILTTFTTNSDGAVTFKSSNEEVAYVDEDGTIVLVGKGTATITATVAETSTFLRDVKSITVTVTLAGISEAVFSAKDEDIQGQGESGAKGVGFGPIVRDKVSLTTNNAYGNTSYMQIYGTNATKGKSSIVLEAEPGHLITEVVLNTTSGYNGKWKDQYDDPAEDAESTSVTVAGNVVTWAGELEYLILTNTSTSQARINSIVVSYTSDIDTAISRTELKNDAEAPLYDLSGRRVSKAGKGIFIQNGKKVLR